MYSYLALFLLGASANTDVRARHTKSIWHMSGELTTCQHPLSGLASWLLCLDDLFCISDSFMSSWAALLLMLIIRFVCVWPEDDTGVKSHCIDITVTDLIESTIQSWTTDSRNSEMMRNWFMPSSWLDYCNKLFTGLPEHRETSAHSKLCSSPINQKQEELTNQSSLSFSALTSCNM